MRNSKQAGADGGEICRENMCVICIKSLLKARVIDLNQGLEFERRTEKFFSFFIPLKY